MAGAKGDKSSSKSVRSSASKDFQLKILPKESKSSTKVKNSKNSEQFADRSGNASRISMADLEFNDTSPVKREKRKGFTGKHEAKKRPEPVRGASSSSELSDTDEDFSNKQPLATSSTKSLGKLPSVRKTASSSDESSDDNDEKLKNWGNESSSESDGKESKSSSPVKVRKSTNSRNKVAMPVKLLGTHQTEEDSEPDVNDSDEDDNVDAGNDLGDPIKVDDLRAGNGVCMKMSHEDLASFVEKMKEHGSVLEKVTEAAKVGKIKWNDLAFNGYTGHDLKNAWAFLRKSRRRQRNLWEVANELEHELKLRKNYKETWLAQHPDMPTKPPGYSSPAHVFTHQQYIKEKEKLKPDQKLSYLEFQKKCFQDFTRLSEKKKAACTQKWEQLRETYLKSLSEFYKSVGYDPIKKKDRPKTTKSRIGGEGLKARSKTLDMFPDAPKPPPTPMDCYVRYRISKLSLPPLPEEMDELASLKASEYLQLKKPKQLKYINRVVKQFEQYQKDVEEYQKVHLDYPAPKNVKLASLLTKEEIEEWEKSQGRPEKPPVSVVGLLERDLIEKGELNPATYGSDAAMRKAVEEKLKKLSYYDRQSYEIESRKAEMDYVKAINEYYENLPAVMKPLVLPSIDKKYRAPAAMRDSPVKTPKKRKVEATAVSSEQSGESTVSTKKKKTKNEIYEIAQAETHLVEEAVGDADAVPKEKRSRKHKHKQRS